MPVSRRRRWALGALLLLLPAAVLIASVRYESYESLYDADYVGSAACAKCHPHVHGAWEQSPHAKMTRRASPESVVGDFTAATWSLPADAERTPDDPPPGTPVMKATRGPAGEYVLWLWYPPERAHRPFPIEYVVGYQYRQTYLFRQPGGVLRRFPLEWSTERREFFPYWNFQERRPVSLPDLWQQMDTTHSAWNLFCARCHVTHLEIHAKDERHRRADATWTEPGIGCEACHGPGSHHANYFAHNVVNRVVAWANSTLRGQPVAYIARPGKLDKGRDLSVCARCHGPDIQMETTDVYRQYEPGYSKDGRINDLSPYFRQFPLEPGRDAPTVECWDHGRPKGIAMVFRSFIESACYERAEVRCYDCHDPHQNGLPRRPGILDASAASNAYCRSCHTAIGDDHARHAPGTPGSFCYDCHMPFEIQNLATGTQRWTRTHTMSAIPDPAATVEHGADGAPNACNACHRDRDASWAVAELARWRRGR